MASLGIDVSRHKNIKKIQMMGMQQLNKLGQNVGVDLVQASEDPVSQPAYDGIKMLQKHTADYKAALENTLKALGELNSQTNKVAEMTSAFFLDDETIDEEHPIMKAMEDYNAVVQEMTEDIPNKMTSLVEDEIIEPTGVWADKISEHAKSAEEMIEARKAYDHYVEKMESLEQDRLRRMDKGKSQAASDSEKATRNQGKPANAEETYQDLRDRWCEEADDVLLPRKSDFLKLALRVVQFQQTLYTSTAKKAAKLSTVIEVIQDTLEKGEQQWEDEDYATHKKRCDKDGGDPNAIRRKVLEKSQNKDNSRRGRRGGNRSDDDDDDEDEESPELASFKRKAGQLDKEMRYMDEGQYAGAIERLESRMTDAGRADRKEMKAVLRDLDDKWQKKGDKAKSRSRNNSTMSGGGGDVDISRVPPEHMATLRKDPSLASEFDKIYGPGASAAILRGAPEPNDGPRKKPKAEHIDMLLNDPSLEGKFDQIYGEGSAQELLRRTGHSSNQKHIPPEHVEKLKANPHLASEFNRIYGPGTSDSILGTSGDDDVMELCLDPDDAPQAPDVPTCNGKEVQQNHIDMLLNNPHLAHKFDEFYGPGGAQQILAHFGAQQQQQQQEPEDDYLNLMHNTMGQGVSHEDDREVAKANAVDTYKAMREAASPKSTVQLKKEPSEKHVQLLRDNPSFAPKFDAVYGDGASDMILNEMEDTYRDGPMFPEENVSLKLPSSISPLDLSKIGGDPAPLGGGGDAAEMSGSPRTTKWRKENETRAAMGLKPKPHPSKKKK